jgi:hypothetical protein
MNQPIRVRASELGVCEADVHGSVRNPLRGIYWLDFGRVLGYAPGEPS